MKIFKLKVSSDNGFQANMGDAPAEFWNKKMYDPYPFTFIDSVCLDLEKGCVKTDVLNIADLYPLGIAVSQNFIDLLSFFTLCEIQHIKITNKSLSDYSIIFFNSDLTNKLDYEKCNFIFIEDFLDEIEVIDDSIPQNRDSIIEFDKKNMGICKMISPKNGYHFIDGFNIFDFDIFRIGHFDTNFYISERFKNAIVEKKITGIEFIEAPLFNSMLQI